MKKVLINASPLTNNYFNRGVGNYTHSLLFNLLKSRDYYWQVVAFGTKEDFIHRLGFTSATELPVDFEFYSLGSPNTLLEKLAPSIWFELKLLPIIHRAAPDVYFTTDFGSGIPKGVKSIAAIHDITPYKSNIYSQKSRLVNNIKRGNYLWALERAKTASKIVTISNFSKEELVSVGFAEEKIAVTPLALSEAYETEVQKLGEEILDSSLKRRVLNSYNITEPYILYLGGLEQNKNVPQVLNSFSKLIGSYPDLKLVIGGGEFKLGWDHKATPLNERAAAIVSLADDLKILHRVIFTGFIQTKDLPVIYRHAKCFVHLSKNEGFGLNVLEPQAVGTPVVAADASSYPEVLKKSAVLVDPDDSDLIAEQIRKFLGADDNTKKVIAEYAQKGKENIKRFSWEDTAAKTMTVIAEVMSSVAEVTPKKEAVIVQAEKTSAPIETKPFSSDKVVAVLATYFSPFTGGMEKVAEDYAQFLNKNDYSVNIITADRKGNKVVIRKEEEYNGMHIHRLARKGENYYFYRLDGLLQKLKQIRPTVVLAHGFGFIWHDLALMSYKRWAKKQGITVKVINTPHGPFMSKQEKGLRQVVKTIFTFIQSLYLNGLMDYVIAVNPRQENWITRSYKINRKKIKVFPPLIPEMKDTFAEVHEHKAKNTDLTITSISRIQEYKGFEDIVAAFNEINTAITTKLVIAGATEDENYLKHLRKIISFSPRKEDIKFETDISNEQRDKYLLESDIFVLASEWEAFGLVIAEAMAAGNAIVSTSTEGGRFLVEPGKNGELFNYSNYRELIAALNKIITDKSLLRSYQEESYNKAKSMDPKVLEERFVKFIDSIGNNNDRA